MPRLKVGLFSQNSMNNLGGAGNMVYFIYYAVNGETIVGQTAISFTYIVFNVLFKSILHILNIWVTSVTGSGSYKLITKNEEQ